MRCGPAHALHGFAPEVSSQRNCLRTVGTDRKVGFWDAAGDRLHWLVHVKAPGRYGLRGEFSSAYGSSGLKVTVAGQSRSAEIPKTDGWFKPQMVSFGEFQFGEPGGFHLVLEAAARERWRAVNVYQVQSARWD